MEKKFFVPFTRCVYVSDTPEGRLARTVVPIAAVYSQIHRVVKTGLGRDNEETRALLHGALDMLAVYMVRSCLDFSGSEIVMEDGSPFWRDTQPPRDSAE